MKVENIIVYRVVTFDTDVQIDALAYPSKREIIEGRKKRIEDSLEANRPDYFPKREKCLYVCFSKENAYEWASIKYGKVNTTYKLLTLEVTGELLWFMSDCYNSLGKNFSQDQLDKACVDYWSSKKENMENLVLEKGYEGLFIGDAVIKIIEYKNYINGESYDVV